MKKQTTNKIDKLYDFIRNNILEMIQLVGLFFIILASMIINYILGLYILGIILVLLSLYIARR